MGSQCFLLLSYLSVLFSCDWTLARSSLKSKMDYHGYHPWSLFSSPRDCLAGQVGWSKDAMTSSQVCCCMSVISHGVLYKIQIAVLLHCLKPNKKSGYLFLFFSLPFSREWCVMAYATFTYDIIHCLELTFAHMYTTGHFLWQVDSRLPGICIHNIIVVILLCLKRTLWPALFTMSSMRHYADLVLGSWTDSADLNISLHTCSSSSSYKKSKSSSAYVKAIDASKRSNFCLSHWAASPDSLSLHFNVFSVQPLQPALFEHAFVRSHKKMSRCWKQMSAECGVFKCGDGEGEGLSSKVGTQ